VVCHRTLAFVTPLARTDGLAISTVTRLRREVWQMADRLDRHLPPTIVSTDLIFPYLLDRAVR